MQQWFWKILDIRTMKDSVPERQETNVRVMSPELPGHVGEEGTQAEPSGLPKVRQYSEGCWEVKALKFSGESMEEKMVGQVQGFGDT